MLIDRSQLWPENRIIWALDAGLVALLHGEVQVGHKGMLRVFAASPGVNVTNLTLFCFITTQPLSLSLFAISSTKMSFSVFRASLRNASVAPLRRSAAQAPNCNKLLFRNTFSRKYSTPPPSPQPKSGNGLYIGIGVAVAGFGLAYYYYDTVSGKEAGTAVKSGIQAAKVKVNFVPTKEDYIKVNQTLFFLFRLSDLLCIGCRYTTRLSTSLTMPANMMVHSIAIRVLFKPPPLHEVIL